MKEGKKPPSLKLFGILLVILIGGFLFLQFRGQQLPGATIELAGQELQVEIANTPTSRYKGLSDRESLAPYDGMLFVMGSRGKHAFVMRDMYFPLDIIWLDNDTVVDIAPNLPPEAGVSAYDLTVYAPRVEATHVLEVPSGWAAEHGLQIGDKLIVPEQ